MILPENKLAQTLIKLCLDSGLDKVVISPGSRNAPLTIGFSGHPFFKCYSIVDERCAGFFALGMAQQSDSPVILLCTSGSALLNYYPAVAEAYYSRVPLIIISADRPEHLINIGDGQTVNQPHVFKNHIFFEANLKSKQRLLSFSNNEKLIRKALQKSIFCHGPVHINIPFEEPLYNTTDSFTISLKSPARTLKSTLLNISERHRRKWYNSQRKMILVGVHPPEKINLKFLEILASDSSVVVLTETTSNLHHDSFFSSIDQLIGSQSDVELKALKPDLLLTFGGMVVSKKIKAFLRTHKPNTHWHVDPYQANDTFFSLSHHFKTDINHFFSEVATINSVKSEYKGKWLLVKKNRALRHEKFLEHCLFSDLMVFNSLSKHLKVPMVLHSANSSTIRYLQLFKLDAQIAIYCNRGTSGIDGSTSTAIGGAVVSSLPNILITGDLSFFYDSNALWNSHIPNNFKIVLVNNSGGGIFRILPGHKKSATFDTFFETKHNLDAKHLCIMYGLDYHTVNTAKQLDSTFSKFFEPSNKPSLLEIFTPADVNDQVLLSYFDNLKG